MTRGVVALLAASLLLASGCAPRAERGDVTAPSDAEKADDDVKELVVRALGQEARFAFAVTFAPGGLPLAARRRFAASGIDVADLAGPGTVALLRARVDDLGVVVAEPGVRRVRCAPPPPPEPPVDDGWRRKVDADLRGVIAAASTCWIDVHMRFATPPEPEERAWFDGIGAQVLGWSADDAIAWVPVRALPSVAAREVVEAIEPAPPIGRGE